LIVSVNVDFDQVAVVTCSVSVGATVSGVPAEVPAGASGPKARGRQVRYGRTAPYSFEHGDIEAS
jgi:hypothetical protein